MISILQRQKLSLRVLDRPGTCHFSRSLLPPPRAVQAGLERKQGHSKAWPLLEALWADKFLHTGTPRRPETSTAPKSCVALGTLLPSVLF